MFKNKTGVSTACFYPLYTEDAFDIVSRLDFNICELFINSVSETKPSFLDRLKKNRGGKMDFTAVHPCFSGYEHTLFFSSYRRRFEDSLDLYKNFFEAAQYLGARYVILHGPSNKTDFDIGFYYDVYAEINETAKKYGVLLCQENVAASPAFISAMSGEAKKGGEVHYVFDLKHAVICGADPVEMIGAMAGNIKHIHLNDYFFDGNLLRKNCRLPFFGGYDYNPMFSKLLTYNYIGNFIIEVYRENYENIEDIRSSAAKFEKFVENFG